MKSLESSKHRQGNWACRIISGIKGKQYRALVEETYVKRYEMRDNVACVHPHAWVHSKKQGKEENVGGERKGKRRGKEEEEGGEERKGDTKVASKLGEW